MPYGTIAADRITGTNGNTFSPESSVFRNRIINGAMTIDQRNAGASVTPANGALTYTVDRWYYYVNQASKLTAQQSTVVPSGFKNSLLTTSSSAYSVGAGDVFLVGQSIEGFNVADLDFGTANAKTVTLSFWVRSSLTGKFGGALVNSGNSRAYAFSYNISSANTFEYKTITIAGDTSGTWNTTNAIGFNLKFSLGAGSTYIGTENSWNAGDIFSPSGCVNLVGTNGATFYITGVQLEVGSQATSFEYREYGAELRMCQRYYYRITPQTSSYNVFGTGYSFTTTSIRVYVPFPVTMRTTPSTFEFSSAGNYLLENNSGLTRAASSIADSTNSGNNGALLTCGVSSTTAGLVFMCLANGTTSVYMGFGAEL